MQRCDTTLTYHRMRKIPLASTTSGADNVGQGPRPLAPNNSVRVPHPIKYSDPHVGVDHPGEWMEAGPNRWVRWIPRETSGE